MSESLSRYETILNAIIDGDDLSSWIPMSREETLLLALKNTIDQLRSTSLKILNKGIVTATSSTYSSICTIYVQTEYSRFPQANDGIVVTLTDSDNDQVLYTYSEISSTWVDMGKASPTISDASPTLKGIAKLYFATGSNTDGSVTQKIITEELNKKQDSEEGKGLSANNFTTEEKNKLNGISDNANNYTLPIATPTVLGGVQPVAKTSDMTQSVGVDASGALFTAAGYTPVRGTDYWTESDKLEIIQAVVDIMGGALIGYVDDNNNIILVGGLVDETYTVKYRMDDDSLIDIGELVLDTNVYHSISNSLTECTNSNSATSVIDGESYSATISANEGYELSSLAVTMGGANITSTAVSGGSISIASVTGNVVITAVAEQAIVAPTNLADPTSSDWLQDSRYSVSGQSIVDAATDTTHITNYIPVKKDDVISFDSTSYFSSNTYGQFAGDASKNKLLIANISNGGSYWSYANNKVTILHDDVKFMRFTLINVSDKNAVTIKINDTTA